MFFKPNKTLSAFVADESGQDFVEYALIAGAIAVVALAVIARFRTALLEAWNRTIQALEAAVS